ncbi:MAG: hypothetical protein JXA07_15820 [Spirochaetes bacterium]|nr:hypothetical protein [Spirochaetota bacterium]
MKSKLVIISLTCICVGLLPVFGTAADTAPKQSKPASMAELYPFSQKGNFELGGVAGMPSGINARWWIVDIFGIDFTIGSTIRRDFVFTLDFLFEHLTLYRSADLHLRFFYGVGGLVGYDYQDKDFYSNVRATIGLSMPFTKYPLTLSLFAAPAYLITPKNKFDANWGIAARYNFGGVSKMLARQRSLQEELDDSRDRYGELSKTLDATKGELDKTAGELGRTRGELDATKGRLDTARDELKATSDSLARTRNELSGTKSELAGIKENLDTTVDELSDTRGKLMSARDQLSGMKRELESTRTELVSTRDQLSQAKRKLDDRESDLLMKQKELDQAKASIRDRLAGEARKAEEKRVEQRQVELDREFQEFKRQKESWEKEHAVQKRKREKLEAECAARRGIINEYGYCDCREHEQWNSDRSACVCVKGYELNSTTDRCEPCELVNYYGACTDACGPDEKKVRHWKGPNKYICIKKCSKKNEAWSDRKNACVCKDGYYRDEKGECVPRK